VNVLGQVVGERATKDDIPLLIEGFFRDDSLSIRTASRALVFLAASEALPPLIRFVEGFDAHQDARLASYRLGEARRILAAAPAILALARVWLNADGWARSSVALSILEQQAEESDVESLRALMSALEREQSDVAETYRGENCLRALAPFAAHVPYTELARVFERTESTWNRALAAQLMAEGHLDAFAGAHAVECLWDCAPDVVEIGAAYADLSSAGVKDRLVHLCNSPFEEDGVRASARERLMRAE